MTSIGGRYRITAVVWFVVILGMSYSGDVYGHCDTINGPVVQDARRALESGNISPVLKWIRAADEPVVHAALEKTLIVRAQGDQARDLADQYFFETIVRVHRAGEGAPYEGLKPPETVASIVVAADDALASGSADALTRKISVSIAEGVQHRFQVALQWKPHAEDSPEAGRRFVSAYVDYVHFVEEVHRFLDDRHERGRTDQRHGHRP